MKTFDDLVFEKIFFRGRGQSQLFFDNGWGVSVISHELSYGGREGLFELAVLDCYGELSYSTPITNDVIGHLKPEEVTELMKKVQELAPEPPINRNNKIEKLLLKNKS